jgi:CRISPR-associated endoribonuclease Cas6
MRFKLNLNLDPLPYGNTIPVNYQYELSGWIYRTLASGDQAYSTWLHENGFTQDRKQFRLFTFSNLHIPKFQIKGDRLTILSDQACIYLSFLPERSTENFIKGIFSSQSFVLGDRLSKMQCFVQSVELVEPPAYEPVMTFRTLSPMVLSGHLENGKPTYISPEDTRAAQLIYNNLCAKYQAFYRQPYTPVSKEIVSMNGESQNQNNSSNNTSFKLLAPPKRKKITIKAHTPQQTFVVAYHTRFQISLPKELTHILYETGVGEKGSMGFGMVEKYEL